MFEKLGVKVLGVIENMSYLLGEDGEKQYIFGKEKVGKLAKEFNIKLLGSIPILPELSTASDMAKPIPFYKPDNIVSKIFENIAKEI